MTDEPQRKRDDFLGEVAGGGAEVGVEAGFAALAEAPPVAAVIAVTAGVGLLGFLAWKSFSRLTAKKNIG